MNNNNNSNIDPFPLYYFKLSDEELYEIIKDTEMCPVNLIASIHFNDNLPGNKNIDFIARDKAIAYNGREWVEYEGDDYYILFGDMIKRYLKEMYMWAHDKKNSEKMPNIEEYFEKFKKEYFKND